MSTRGGRNLCLYARHASYIYRWGVFLGSDAEVRSNDNRSFTTLSLATKSSYKKDGKYISHTEWHRCVVFGNLSEFAGTLKKGAHIQVEGELRSRE